MSENLENDIRSFIQSSYPSYYHENIINPKKDKIDYFSKVFSEFKEIEESNERHNLKWAFSSASKAFDFSGLKHPSNQTDCFIAYDDVVSEVYIKAITKINRLSRRFSLLSMGVSFMDIVVSVLLILLVTVIAQQAEKIFDTILFSTLFIGAVALTKVSADRFAIIPAIDRYGWKLFSVGIINARNETIKLNGILLVLIESINRKEPVETRFKLINENKH